MKRVFLLFSIATILFFYACTNNALEATTGTTDPHIGKSIQEDFTLPVLDIPAKDRCAMTGNCTFAETDSGYYMMRYGYLFYADKSDLGNWVLVCSEPDCSHEAGFCPGHLGSLCGFWVKDDSIYYMSNKIDQQLSDGFHFIKMNLDGTSREIVYTDPSINENYSGGGSMTEGGIKDSYCCCIVNMQADGDWNCRIVKINKGGTKTLFSGIYPPSSNGSIPLPWTYNLLFSVRGDFLINSKLPLDGTPDENKADWENRSSDQYYQIYGDSIRALVLSESCDLYGAYISGDSLWHYHVNDGFYYMDLSTGEEVKIADAAYADAHGFCVDGDHMIECTFGEVGQNGNPEKPDMRYFDGETWIELEIPEHWNNNYSFRLWAATSDRIFFSIYDYNLRKTDSEEEMCYILLGDDKITVCDKWPYRLSFD